MNLSLRPFLSLLLGLAIFAGFQGGRYFMSNRLQELGIAAALTVFAVGAWVSLFRIGYREWRRWVLTPIALVSLIMGLWSLVFIARYGGSVLYSFLASREFLLAFVGPAAYLAVRSGLPIARLQRVIWVALVALALNYVWWWSTLDLRAAFFSSDHTVSNLVTYDEWRGFRLKPPLFAIMILLLAGVLRLLQPGQPLKRLLALGAVLLCAWIWSIVLFRSTLATMILAVFLYPVLLLNPARGRLLILLAPLAVIAAPPVLGAAVEHFLGSDGGDVRLKSFQLAWRHIPTKLLLGVGEDNAYGQTYQDLFAYYFYPSDLGLTGVLFKYGALGTALYLAMHGLIWWRLWSTNWRVVDHDGRHQPLLWALLMFMTAQTFNLMLNPGLAFAQGITAGSLALALAALHRLRIDSGPEHGRMDPCSNPAGPAGPIVAGAPA